MSVIPPPNGCYPTPLRSDWNFVSRHRPIVLVLSELPVSQLENRGCFHCKLMYDIFLGFVTLSFCRHVWWKAPWSTPPRRWWHFPTSHHQSTSRLSCTTAKFGNTSGCTQKTSTSWSSFSSTQRSSESTKRTISAPLAGGVSTRWSHDGRGWEFAGEGEGTNKKEVLFPETQFPNYVLLFCFHPATLWTMCVGVSLASLCRKNLRCLLSFVHWKSPQTCSERKIENLSVPDGENTSSCGSLSEFPVLWRQETQTGTQYTACVLTQCFVDLTRWQVEVLNKTADRTRTETFDAVMVCTGHHADPYIPDFPGDQDFQVTLHICAQKNCINFLACNFPGNVKCKRTCAQENVWNFVVHPVMWHRPFNSVRQAVQCGWGSSTTTRMMRKAGVQKATSISTAWPKNSHLGSTVGQTDLKWKIDSLPFWSS